MATESNQQKHLTKKTIDLEKVIESKSKRVKQLMPRFVLNYLKRVIHEDELNKLLYENRDKFGLEFLDSILENFGVDIEVMGAENIPTDGRYIIVSNHPLGGLDGMALMKVTGRVRKDIVFPVNDLLLFLPNLRELFIPINKHGTNAENIRIIHETFASDKLILYFPAGLVSRKQKGGVIEDVEWKKTFVTKAIRYKRDVIPVFINGRNSNFFYNLANLRKRSGLKANIEMLYLVDEMYKQENNKIVVNFGKPVPYGIFKEKHNHREWAARMKEHVYNMGSGKPSIFDY